MKFVWRKGNTYGGEGGCTIVNNSSGVLGTRRITSFWPSLEPIPMEANDRTDVTSEIIFGDNESLLINEPAPRSLPILDVVRSKGSRESRWALLFPLLVGM